MSQAPPGAIFKQAIVATGCLRLQQGLQAIKKSEGRGKIVARDKDKVLGSVCIDDDCRRAEPSANRWDYAVGYNREGKAHVFYIEEHSADSHGVSEMENKIEWLLAFLRRPPNGRLLSLTPRPEFHWLQHDGMDIPKHTSQYRRLVKLRASGLVGPVRSVTLS